MCCACNIGHNRLCCGDSCKVCCSSFCLELEKAKYASPLGDFPMDLDSQIRENGHGAIDTNKEQPTNSTEGLATVDIIKSIDKLNFHDKNNSDERQENSNDNKVGLLEDVRSIIDGDESDEAENSIQTTNTSFLSTIETDPNIWVPPPPVDIEDDIESVANNDDDDEYSDGTKWGQSSCLSGEENGSSLKEERQRAMMDAMNGQFKILVSRFLASEDIGGFSEAGNGEKWLDIVFSLSWEAALLIKPEANEGRAMDPGSYVKVKCVASGARSQSEVVRGLVFKKNTAHKHMPTKFKNPRLLLLQGVLGHRDVGLSSFKSMEQENDYLKSIHDMIETCHPNVVLVEKSVSRDMQEFLLAKGMTLVFDMKLTRLNRIARCIGSPIISWGDIVTKPMVKQCDMFHIEKFIEEHNGTSEGGKKSSKTLMFLEGFPKPLGCTILLKGAPIVELKKVKRVLQYTIFAAYHLILETSFFADQRALFSNKHAEENGSVKANSCIQDNPVGISQECTSNIPSSNGSLENSMHEVVESNGYSQSPRFQTNDVSNENNHGDVVNDNDIPWQYMSSFSSSLKRFLSDSFPPVNSESMSSYFGYNNEELDAESVAPLSISPSLEVHEHETEANGDLVEEKPHDEISNIEKAEPLSSLDETHAHEHNNSKDNIENVMDPQSILVLQSSQCTAKGVVCEQSHLSRIKYYGNFDVTLGCFLCDTLLNQDHCCSSCGEPPEAHVYCYTHQNGNLTVLVKQLPQKSTLSGEAEGRIWMWTRCLKCEEETGIPQSTKRVVMSNEARGLSFGKFLELSFSSHSVASRLSSKCGHSLHRDCLRFFGLGSKVAMFRYSSVEIYAACKPPPVLEFSYPNGQEWIKKEAKSVLQKGDRLFLEAGNYLKKLNHEDFGLLQKQSSNSQNDICEIEKMLIQEKSEFEASLLKAINFIGKLGKAVNEIHSLSWLNQELILLVYIWDRRLHSLLQSTKENNEFQEQHLQEDTTPCDNYVKGNRENCGTDLSTSELEQKTESVKNSENDSSSHSFIESELKTDNTNNVSEDPAEWIWANYAELRKNYRSDLSGGSLHKFEYIHSYTPKYLSTIQLAAQEKELLHFPIGADNSVISVNEDDISSIIACSLAISEDQHNLLENVDEKDALEGKLDVKAHDNSHSLLSDGSSSSFWSSTGSLESEGIHPSRSVSSISSDESSAANSENSYSVEIRHPEVNVIGGRSSARNNKCSVVLFHAKKFSALRKMCCPSELAYISSLIRSKRWDAQGGKSKAFFAKTLDDRFIIKQVNKTEIESFLRFAGEYFRHIYYSISSGSQTCLAKILGIYQIRHSRGGKEVKMDLMVMENLLFGRNFTRTYDLKGAVYSRYITDSNDPEKVFLDQNFIEDMRISPMYIAGRNKHLFQRAIWNDTSFLTSINVMDYSLLVGVDKQGHELVFGIIDYLRQYTWDKQLETWVKSSLVLPKNSLPTIISPKEYKKRFRKFMSKYFLTVPDTWRSEQCSGPCKFCNDGTRGSSDEKQPS